MISGPGISWSEDEQKKREMRLFIRLVPPFPLSQSLAVEQRFLSLGEDVESSLWIPYGSSFSPSPGKMDTSLLPLLLVISPEPMDIMPLFFDVFHIPTGDSISALGPLKCGLVVSVNDITWEHHSQTS